MYCFSQLPSLDLEIKGDLLGSRQVDQLGKTYRSKGWLWPTMFWKLSKETLSYPGQRLSVWHRHAPPHISFSAHAKRTPCALPCDPRAIEKSRDPIHVCVCACLWSWHPSFGVVLKGTETDRLQYCGSLKKHAAMKHILIKRPDEDHVWNNSHQDACCLRLASF